MTGGENPTRNSQPATRNSPLVLTRTIASRQLVVAVCEVAHRAGIRPGMTLGQARAIRPDVEHCEHEPHRDEAALEALARWMMRFSPVVALDTPVVLRRDGTMFAGRPGGRLDAAGMERIRPDEIAFARHGIFLDLTGCQRLFRGLENLVAQVEAALRRFGLRARLATGETPGAAWARTFGEEKRRRDEETERPSAQTTPSLCLFVSPSLLDLPISSLRLTSETLRLLHHLGVETIGQLMKLPRESLPARFGPLLTLRLDQLTGRVAEPLAPLREPAPIEARVEFEGAVESLEAIWLTFKELVGRVVRDLAARGRGARVMQAIFHRPYRERLERTIRLSRPSRDPVNLFNLLRCALEELEANDGFLGIELKVPVVERVIEEQIPLLDHERYAGESELAGLVERLLLRLGERAAVRAELVESHLPERAWKEEPGIEVRRSARASAVAPAFCAPGARPSRLWAPAEVQVMVSPSEDDEGRPVLFRRAGMLHRLRHAIGPERIAGEWWRGHHHTRDYFNVEDETGRRFWLFRVRATRKWYVQGAFE